MGIRVSGGNNHDNHDKHEQRNAKFRLTQEQRQKMFEQEMKAAKDAGQHKVKQGCNKCRRNSGG